MPTPHISAEQGDIAEAITELNSAGCSIHSPAIIRNRLRFASSPVGKSLITVLSSNRLTGHLAEPGTRGLVLGAGDGVRPVPDPVLTQGERSSSVSTRPPGHS